MVTTWNIRPVQIRRQGQERVEAMVQDQSGLIESPADKSEFYTLRIALWGIENSSLSCSISFDATKERSAYRDETGTDRNTEHLSSQTYGPLSGSLRSQPASSIIGLTQAPA